MTFLIQSFIRLRNMEIIFFVRRHIDKFIRNARIFRIGFIDDTIRSLYKSILIDSCITGQGIDQSDVRTFRRFNRAHPSIMRVMHVAHLKSRAVTGKSSRPQSGKTPLVRQLAKRIVLIHKLGQLGRAEKLFYRSRYRFNINQALR